MEWRTKEDIWLQKRIENLETKLSILNAGHPENRCQSCGAKNPSWHAPSKLWNKITNNAPGLIICPRCFQDLCEEHGITVHCVVDVYK